MKRTIQMIGLVLIAGLLANCGNQTTENTSGDDEKADVSAQLLEKYVPVELTADISHLSDNEKEMLRHLFKAAGIMDELFWLQNVGPKQEVLSGIADENLRKFAEINYGYWDELDNLKPFVEGIGEKPAGARFYPEDMTKEEFESYQHSEKAGLYTLIIRNEDGGLETVWYHEAYKQQLTEAAGWLRKAASLAADPEFARYLELRADALLTSNYRPSDMAWFDVKNNHVDMVIGPIENYTDQLFGYKAAFESFILIKDKVWSEKLSKFAAFLPQLQKELPVDPAYKQEVPGADSELNAYEVVFYAGDCNMAGKTIAINLPNDEVVQLEKGTRKLQLKNAMKAKFDKILVPIAGSLIDESQVSHISFDAFFANTMFHEVAHGMGIKNTINGKGTVRQALKEQYSAIEEGKADILGLYLVTKLNEMGEFPETDLMDNYVTFMAGIFRSVRFGASSAHGKANMIRFNYFYEAGAFSRNENGKYLIDMEKMKEAATGLTNLILKIQGDGDYDAAKKLVDEKGVIGKILQDDLNSLNDKGIPVDIIFSQGPGMLGL
ncbi:MAG: Zn-dependent hydrolase [Bacteroidales bacterium]|nr:Zn-dependent hydrolase [Bacteroidales bacterium]